MQKKKEEFEQKGQKISTNLEWSVMTVTVLCTPTLSIWSRKAPTTSLAQYQLPLWHSTICVPNDPYVFSGSLCDGMNASQ